MYTYMCVRTYECPLTLLPSGPGMWHLPKVSRHAGRSALCGVSRGRATDQFKDGPKVPRENWCKRRAQHRTEASNLAPTLSGKSLGVQGKTQEIPSLTFQKEKELGGSKLVSRCPAKYHASFSGPCPRPLEGKHIWLKTERHL